MKPTNSVYVGGPPLDPHECDLECANCGYEYDRWELEFTGGKCPSCKKSPAEVEAIGDLEKSRWKL